MSRTFLKAFKERQDKAISRKELKRRKINGLIEKLSDELGDVFPARHWAHVNIFTKLHGLEKEFEKSF